MVDLHCHLLPGLDDGADIPEESLQMAALAAEGGTHAIVCTPHASAPHPCPPALLIERLSALQTLINRQQIKLSLFAGQEIFLTGAFLAHLATGQLLTLAGSVYVLVEFDFEERAESAYRKLAELHSAGYIPIVAHPERCRFVAALPDAADRIKDAGALLQINKGSFKGAFGERAARTAYRLLAGRKADFVASDAHSPYIRTPYLRDAHELISEACSIDYADYLLHENPLRVLHNQKIYSY